MANVSKEVYFRDLKLKENSSKVLAVLPALAGVFLPIGGFMTIISLIGTISSIISGGLICFMVYRVSPKLRFWSALVFLVLLSGGAVTFLKGF